MNKEISNEKAISNENTEEINTNELNLIDIKQIKKYCGRNECFSEHYELLNIIGNGSECIVCGCLAKTIKKKIALKIIFNKKNKKLNLNELEISSKLKHKNIINYFGDFNLIKNDSWCILMELGKLGNLNNFRRNLLRTQCLRESLICYMAYQILEGLIYCYKKKIAHMDIKPNNIIVDEYLNLKIIDFSISINYGDKKYNEKIKLQKIGTSLYMPLEVLIKQKIEYRELHKVDLYSFGVLLYNLAFGTYPYNITYDDQKDYSQIEEKIYINEIGIKINDGKNGYSSHFKDFLCKLLEKDIHKRINIYEAKEHYWLKGSKILLNEKENINNSRIFSTYLLSNSIKKFNDYIANNS